MGVERMDCRNWDEDAYREHFRGERNPYADRFPRHIFSNAYPNPNSDHIATATSDGSVASYSISSCLPYGCGTARGKNWLTAEPNFLTQGHDGPAYDVKFYGEEDDSLLLSCGDDCRIPGWKWKEIMGSEAPTQGGKLKPVLDLVNPQHKGPWGARPLLFQRTMLWQLIVRGDPSMQLLVILVRIAGMCDQENCEVKTVFKGHSNYIHCIAACKLSNQACGKGQSSGFCHLYTS